eukprot:9419995-Ditylum_brightwellii.AAC.1
MYSINEAIRALSEEKSSARANVNADMINQIAALKERLSSSDANILILNKEKDVLCQQNTSLESTLQV